MKSNERDGKVIISLEGRIDSNNASQTETEILEIFDKNADKERYLLMRLISNIYRVPDSGFC